MPDREKVISGLRFCFDETLGIVSCDGCVYSDSKTFKNGVTHCYLVDDAIELLKEQEETIRNREQEIRDKNERLKERAEQVDSMLKEQKPVEPSRDIALNRRCPKCFAILKGKFCHKCGQAVKWDEYQGVFRKVQGSISDLF